MNTELAQTASTRRRAFASASFQGFTTKLAKDAK